MDKIQALRILNSRTVITGPGIYETPIRTSGVVVEDALGNNQVLFSTKLMTSYHEEKAMEALVAENYDNAVNKTELSFRVPLNELDDFKSVFTARVKVEEVENKDGELILVIQSARPVVTVQQTRKSAFAELLKAAQVETTGESNAATGDATQSTPAPEDNLVLTGATSVENDD